MPKPKGKGGKKGRRGKNAPDMGKRELVFKEEGQSYGVVQKLLGNSRIEVKCYDGKTRKCRICGKMRKKIWIKAGDLVLVSIRDFEPDKGDCILKYQDDEIPLMRKYGEIDKDPQDFLEEGIGFVPASAHSDDDDDETESSSDVDISDL